MVRRSRIDGGALTTRRRMDMTGGISFKKSHLRAVAAVAVVLGAGLIAAAPARADHDGGPDIGFHFFFGGGHFGAGAAINNVDVCGAGA